jgi:putative restriction endonuclease
MVCTLDAAHISAYDGPLSNDVRNGVCLRVDLHRLFDAGLICINDEYTVHVDIRVRDEAYRSFSGRLMRLPALREHWPAKQLLRKKHGT